ncbi:MAG: hypothetical protein GF401_17800 [Chitinivibrionales bacterium]|nr:hypothetical protein [Chitinivibrionales bacterium]
MALSSIVTSGVGINTPFPSRRQNPIKQPSSALHQHAPSSQRTQPKTYRNASLTKEYYSSKSLSMEFQSKDGDTVTLDMQHVEYQKSMITVNGGSMSDADWERIVENLKDEFSQLQKELIDSFIGSVEGETGKVNKSEEPEIADVPEFWNAENTSQRIVDFSLSFIEMYEGSDQEYLDLMKGAIEEGFSQAREMIGEVPGAVENLTNETYNLTMDKLAAWAEERGLEFDIEQAV